MSNFLNHTLSSSSTILSAAAAGANETTERFRLALDDFVTVHPHLTCALIAVSVSLATHLALFVFARLFDFALAKCRPFVRRCRLRRGGGRSFRVHISDAPLLSSNGPFSHSQFTQHQQRASGKSQLLHKVPTIEADGGADDDNVGIANAEKAKRTTTPVATSRQRHQQRGLRLSSSGSGGRIGARRTTTTVDTTGAAANAVPETAGGSKAAPNAKEKTTTAKFWTDPNKFFSLTTDDEDEEEEGKNGRRSAAGIA
ncbi:hypothetical protein niasHT_030897 [Heterodera trifolii]|uniref:Transmembrane protein n=1 Tax=Heterodera trifolii TaxID=157864 RepID=A0ABD2HUG5_9BILA